MTLNYLVRDDLKLSPSEEVKLRLVLNACLLALHHSDLGPGFRFSEGTWFP
jgi:hypothetical protein